MNKVATVGAVYALAQHYELQFTKANLAMATTECSICQLRDQCWVPGMAPFPRVTRQLSAGRLMTDHFQDRRSTVLFLLDGYSLWIQICLPYTQSS